MQDLYPKIVPLDPDIPESLTMQQSMVLWMDLMENYEQVILNRLREEVGPNGDVIAAYRRWHAEKMEEHDRSQMHMMTESQRREVEAARRKAVESSS